MQQVKDFINFLDYIVATFWGFTLVEIIPVVVTGGLFPNMLSSISDFIKVLFAIAGLIYLIVRLIHFVRMSKINLEIRKEELYEKQNANFKNKFNKEFLQ